MPRREFQKQPAPPPAFSGDPAEWPPDIVDALLRLPDPSPLLILFYCERCLSSPDPDEQGCVDALRYRERALLEQSDPKRLADVVLGLSGPAAEALSSPFFLRLGACLERAGAYEQAIQIYYRLGETKTHSFDFETALWRLARMAEEVYADKPQAAVFYAEMRRLFPDGRWSDESPPEAAR